LGLDFDYYPTREQQLSFLHAYLSEFHGESEETVKSKRGAEVAALYARIGKYSLVSHLLWYAWTRSQVRISHIEYFDYLKYGDTRLARYWATRDAMLALSHKETVQFV